MAAATVVVPVEWIKNWEKSGRGEFLEPDASFARSPRRANRPDSLPSSPPAAAMPGASRRAPVGTSRPPGERSFGLSRPRAAPLAVGEV